jgi:1,4-alpha-glucan branching enzyme
LALPPGGRAVYLFSSPRSCWERYRVFDGAASNGQTLDLLLSKDADGYWAGFLAGANEGDLYHYWVVGPGSAGYKRDPYARGLAKDVPFPASSSIIRSGTAYPWHDAEFITPDFSDMIVYQIHVGTYATSTPGTTSTFLDLIGKIPYLVSLGINVLQPLPIDEVEAEQSMGYNGADYFCPDFPYVVTDRNALTGYLATINSLLEAKGQTPLALADILTGHAQVSALVDVCHVYGIAVVFDVVYNHAGGFTVNGAFDDQCLYFFDRLPNFGNNPNDSLYVTDQDRGTGGLAFASGTTTSANSLSTTQPITSRNFTPMAFGMTRSVLCCPQTRTQAGVSVTI